MKGVYQINLVHLFYIIVTSILRGRFLSSSSGQIFASKNLNWSELNESPPLLAIIQLQRLESPAIPLSRSKQKSASRSRVPMSCDSKRAASAFKLALLIQIVLLVLRSCVLLGGLLVLVLLHECVHFRIGVLRRGNERRVRLVNRKLVSLLFRREGLRVLVRIPFEYLLLLHLERR